MDKRKETCYQQTRGNGFYATINGSGNVFAAEMTHGGEHSDDVDRWLLMHNNSLRDKMIAMFRNKDLRRPNKLS